ncbi:hypothetical protein AAFF_G00008800 [Aldrovandia affinis]|uniref:Uncharacterized protein n=1 Tax=Aldrovandia affinis TaxID=143900 RepID=A0AAD7WZQ6_9TELE|nr:hypothetical protein AAFF_G00008800 [Aldrovandia affinis]
MIFRISQSIPFAREAVLAERGGDFGTPGGGREAARGGRVEERRARCPSRQRERTGGEARGCGLRFVSLSPSALFQLPVPCSLQAPLMRPRLC